MKYILTLLFLLSFTFSFSQSFNEVKRFKDEIQSGYHVLINNEWKAHGIWKSHYGKAKYEYGKLIWMKIGNMPKISGSEIRITQLERKIQKLKSELASN